MPKTASRMMQRIFCDTVPLIYLWKKIQNVGVVSLRGFFEIETLAHAAKVADFLEFNS